MTPATELRKERKAPKTVRTARPCLGGALAGIREPGFVSKRLRFLRLGTTTAIAVAGGRGLLAPHARGGYETGRASSGPPLAVAPGFLPRLGPRPYGYTRWSKRFNVSTPTFRRPCLSSASAEAASASSASGGERSSMNRCSHRLAARS